MAAFIGNMVNVVFATTKMSVNRASTECQQSVNRASTERQQSVNRASTERQQSVNRASTERQQSVNRASTILGVASCMIHGLCYVIGAYSTYRQPLCSKEQATWSQPHCENERQQSVNDFRCCILYNPRAVLWHLCIIEVLAAFIGNIVNVDVAAPENEHQQSVNRASTERQQSVNRASTERQHSVKRASTERQQSWVLHLV